MPKGDIIGHITVNNPDAYAEFVRRDTPTLDGCGGKDVVAGPKSPKMWRTIVTSPSNSRISKARSAPAPTPPVWWSPKSVAKPQAAQSILSRGCK